MKKELQGLEEGSEAEILQEWLRAILEKIPNWKIAGQGGLHGFWFEKFLSIHDRLVLQLNRCLDIIDIPERIDKTQSTLIQEEPFLQKGTISGN